VSVAATLPAEVWQVLDRSITVEYTSLTRAGAPVIFLRKGGKLKPRVASEAARPDSPFPPCGCREPTTTR
jgi:hypothetical protein